MTHRNNRLENAHVVVSGKISGMKYIYLLTLLCFTGFCIAQETAADTVEQVRLDTIPLMEWPEEPREYEIGGIKVTGSFNSDENALKSVAGLRVGDKITVPGPGISQAVLSLWKLRLFTDVQIIQEKTIGDHIFLNIYLQERERLSRYTYSGVKKSEHDDLNDAVEPFLIKGQIVSEDTKLNATRAIERYYEDKGHLDAEVAVTERPDPALRNAVILTFDVDPHDRVKIKDIIFDGNDNVKSRKLRKLMSETKPKRRFLAKSRLMMKEYKADKKSIVAHYNTIGYRDMQILDDTIWRNDDGEVIIQMDIREGQQYYFGDIAWKGNSIHSDERLTQVLGIKEGDVYDDEQLELRLRFSLDGRDVSSLYLDDGYLFFDVKPVEVAVRNDTIDLEMRIFEGPQATIDQVIIEGNDRTHEHVIRRELRTMPGQKFSRADIIRSQRQIINLGYFNPETISIETPVDPQRGTVDIIYGVEERPSDQLELSAGWGGFGRSRVIGTLGVTFNNFSLRNVFNRDAWHPLPQGDGQRLSIRAQTNGDFYQSYNFSFTEPWLGGNKPTSFTVGAVYTAFNNEFFNGGKLAITRAFTGLGTRLRWPDDNFVFNGQVNIEGIQLDDYATQDFIWKDQIVANGNFNNFSVNLTLARSTINEPIFPRSGSKVSLSAQLTPPYTTLFGRVVEDYNDAQDALRWVEYHKWRFDVEWYAPLVGKFVIKAGAKFGLLGYYNPEIGTPPFERFELGGDGISNQRYGITGKDIFALRGYDDHDLPANNSGGASIFDKLTVELRYPLALEPNSTIYALAFAEGGNSWTRFNDFNPFDLRRSAGFGVRVFLPMFGLLGFDYGWGWDKPSLIQNDAKWSEFGKFSIILGFEPE